MKSARSPPEEGDEVVDEGRGFTLEYVATSTDCGCGDACAIEGGPVSASCILFKILDGPIAVVPVAKE